MSPREHDTFRQSRSANTPEPTRAELARFQELIVPPHRTRHERTLLGDELTVGDVLDARPRDRCWLRRFWYSTERQQLGLIRIPCTKWHCPVCVVGKLVGFDAPAWAYWHHRRARRVDYFEATGEIVETAAVSAVELIEFEDATTWENYRRSAKLKMRGPSAVPGVLVLPDWSGARRAFLPGATGLRGAELDAAFLNAVRTLPVVLPDGLVTREPNPHNRTVPPWVTGDDEVRAADEARVELHGRGRGVETTPGTTTPEQARTFWEALIRN